VRGGADECLAAVDAPDAADEQVVEGAAGALGVASPRSALEISAILRAAQTHGVPVTVRRIAEMGDVGALLIDCAKEDDCDLIVAGAYGHNRLREWVLGGVTYSLLNWSNVPCLFSH